MGNLKNLILLFTLVAFIGMTSLVKANDIISADPTKVLIDTTTGMVIYMPRDIDYEYALQKAALEAQVTVTLEGMRPVSIKDKIFGKCKKGGNR